MPIPELRSTAVIDGKDVPWLREVESRGRTSHIHWDGCEVQRQFYVNHYWTAPHVCGALLGFVLRDGNIYKRYLPAVDPIYNQILYCNEARWDHVDGDKKSISNASPIAAVAGKVSNIQAYSHFMFEIKRVGENKVKVDNDGRITEGVPGGAFITASYRPLISGYHPQRYNNILTDADRLRQFDFMDPILTSGTQTVPWPDGLTMISRGKLGGLLNPDTVPGELADPITIPLIQFTVRRMFLGKVPYQALNQLLNHVNSAAWPSGTVAGLAWAWTFPQFPAETLRFDSYEETRHWSQLSDLNKWHEVKLNFSWRNHYDHTVHDSDGQHLPVGSAVTWNHILANPINEDLAWYRIFRESDDFRFPLYSPGNFDNLFATVTPQSK